MVTCPRCGNPAIYMVSEEFKLPDCEFCDDAIDVSDQELPELEPAWPKRDQRQAKRHGYLLKRTAPDLGKRPSGKSMSSSPWDL